jgi:hypothetical protein
MNFMGSFQICVKFVISWIYVVLNMNVEYYLNTKIMCMIFMYK